MNRSLYALFFASMLLLMQQPVSNNLLETSQIHNSQASLATSYVLDSFESLNSTSSSYITSIDVTTDGMVGCGAFEGTMDNIPLNISGKSSLGGKDILLYGWTQSSGYWSTSIGGSLDDSCWKVRWIDSSKIVLSGSFQGQMVLGNTTVISDGAKDAFMAKYDFINSTWEASSTIGSDGAEEMRSVLVLSNGTFAGVATSTGNISAYHSDVDSPDCSATNPPSITACSILLFFDKDLNISGITTLKSTGNVVAMDIIETAGTHEIIMVGYFNKVMYYYDINDQYQEVTSRGSSTYDAFVCKFNSNGRHVFVGAYGGSSNDDFRSIEKTSTGFVVSGTTVSTNTSVASVYKPNSQGWSSPTTNGGKDIMVLQLSSTGLITDGYTFGTENNDGVGEIGVDQNDMVFVTGYIGSEWTPSGGNGSFGVLDKKSAILAIINFSGGATTQIDEFYASTGSNNGDARLNAVGLHTDTDIWLGGRLAPGPQTNTFFGKYASGYNQAGFSLRIGLDSDVDGVAKRIDNCPTISNPNQHDYDDDGYGDFCDSDDDNDGILDIEDSLCPFSVSKSFISDSFNDNDGDGCEDSTEDDDDDNDGYSDTYESNLDCPKGVSNWSAGDPLYDRDADGCHDQLEDLDDDGDSYLDATNDACGMATSVVYDVNTWMDRDLDGCHDDEDLDVDNDGILNAQDACDASLIGWQSDVQSDYDQDGCHDVLSDLDDDNDGIADYYDMCTPPSAYSILGTSMLIPWTDYDGDGCHDEEEDMDDDNDGIEDIHDTCPLGTTNWSSVGSNDYDSDGCHDSIEDTDDDGDELEDYLDECDPDSGFQSLRNWTSNIATDHDADGCSDDGEISSGIEEDSDDDNDGIADVIDGIEGSCRLSNLALERVDYDSDGCFDGEDDDMDNDALENSIDTCPRSISLQFKSTPLNDHDADGCEDEIEDEDDDNDGVDDADDVQCQTGDLFTSSAETDWDEDGCQDSTEDNDDDNDGIIDTMDQCDVEDGVFTENLPWTSGPNTDYDRDGCRDDGSENGNQGEDDDDDNDGVKDYQEGLDENGAPCLYTRQPSVDDDKDGCANYEDPDDDNDGMTDTQETKNADEDATRKQSIIYFALGVFGVCLVAAFRRPIYQVAGDLITAINSVVNTGAGDQSVGHPMNSPSPNQQNSKQEDIGRDGFTLVLNFKPGQLSLPAFDAAMLEMVGANFYATKGTLQKTLKSDEKKRILKLNQDGWNVTVARSPSESIACKYFTGASNAHSIHRLDLNIRYSITNPRELSEDMSDKAGRLTNEQYWMSVLTKSQVLNSWMNHSKEELRNKILSTLRQSTTITFIDEEFSLEIETYRLEELRVHSSYRPKLQLEMNVDYPFGVIGSLKILGEACGQLIMDNLETHVTAGGTLCVLDTVHFENTAEDLLILYPKDEQFWEFIRRLN